MKGNLLKMKAELGKEVQYSLPLGDQLIPLNPMIGKKINLKWSGLIHDIHDGKIIKKSYAQGFSYKNFISLACCDTCIVKPELCHYNEGTCRQPEWGEKNCLIPHVVYLSITSGVKVGITRATQVPTRWIDQGASFALPILKVADRKTSGLIEIELAKEMADKTNWRNMLKGVFEQVDLELIRDQIYDQWGDLLDDHGAEDIEEEVLAIHYPLKGPPPKLVSMGFEKTPEIEGTLVGIKGQYLILDTGVLNIRKHQGYEINFKE
jgi:hypothetical protein